MGRAMTRRRELLSRIRNDDRNEPRAVLSYPGGHLELWGALGAVLGHPGRIALSRPARPGPREKV
eukprot:4805896-Pyramimonas_sp.AAC.1